MSSNTGAHPSARDYWARYHIDQALKKSLPSSQLGKDGELSDPPEIEFPRPPPKDGPTKVCIIGAGAAGLFTAMLFDYLNSTLSKVGFNVDYDIFEAGKEVGGRLYTYPFTEITEQNPHDYYDVGAMRFPNNPVMTRYNWPSGAYHR
jgi:NADPH-dependent 2,4-dienoyl-CoA reductase/sulfur reductase-like enzyme